MSLPQSQHCACRDIATPASSNQQANNKWEFINAVAVAHELPVKDQGVKQGHIIVEQDEVDGPFMLGEFVLSKAGEIPAAGLRSGRAEGGAAATVNEAVEEEEDVRALKPKRKLQS
jgi:hypothetical protein